MSAILFTISKMVLIQLCEIQYGCCVEKLIQILTGFLGAIDSKLTLELEI